MSTFQERIETYVGDISVSETDTIDVWLQEEARNFISILPISHLYNFQSWVDADTSLANGRFLHKVKLGDGNGRTYVATEVPYEKLATYLDEESLYYATNRNPVYAIANNSLETAPENLIDDSESKILFIAYPSPTYDSSSLSGYPKQIEEYIVLGASIKSILSKLFTNIESITSNIPTSPLAPSFVYTDAEGTTTTTTEIDISSLTLPSYISPTSDIDFTTANNLINTEEDIELAQTELAQQNSKINAYGAEITDAVKEFEKDLAIYKTQVEEKFQNATFLQQKLLSDSQRLDNIELANVAKQLEVQISNYMSSIQRYQADVAKYEADIIAKSNKSDRYFGLLTKLREQKLEVLQTYLGQIYQGNKQ